ncbi:hypothetical protein LINPERHAP1_LOCUS26635 [Linum perenne]
MDEFSYEDDDVRCICELRALRRISRTEENSNRKFFGCPLYYSAIIYGLFQMNMLPLVLRMLTMFVHLGFSFIQDDKGCDFFL